MDESPHPDGMDNRAAVLSVGLIAKKNVERWGMWEMHFRRNRERENIDGNPGEAPPFAGITLRGRFATGARSIDVDGFRDGEGEYCIRFMPDELGVWSYRIDSSVPGVDGAFGCFECVPPRNGNHGPVLVDHVHHFRYADGAPYRPFGTTCYAWIHQDESLRERTLASLASSPFNKIRMCVFPKFYDYNREDPALFPFSGNAECGWDFSRFDPGFFRALEKGIAALRDLGIEADLILFHPYDRWGFSRMTAEFDENYLRYIVARFGAFRNVWWSLANEYDLLKGKTLADWDRLGELLQSIDSYSHLRSIHNCMVFYDNSRPWISHASVQRVDVYRTAENVDEWRLRWGKPVIVDECGYEGDINWGWGNLTGGELVRRCWEGAIRGGYVGHGETFVSDDDVLWWSKGGELKGESARHIAFLRSVLEDGPPGGIDPSSSFGWSHWDLPTAGAADGSYYLFYFGFNRPSFRVFELGTDRRYAVDIIDTWNMSVESLPGRHSGRLRIQLPGRQYMAVRMRAEIAEESANEGPASGAATTAAAE